MNSAGNTDILIVEDQDNMRALLREYLQFAFPGSTVLEAANGHSALELAHGRRPRLVVMDVNLPDANGIELTTLIRAALPDTEVIVVSQFDGQAYIDHAAVAGAFAYVIKERIHAELLPLARRVFHGALGNGEKRPC